MASIVSTNIETGAPIWSVFGAIPDYRLVNRLPAEEWQRLDAVPVGATSTSVRVATARGLLPEDIAFIEQAFRAPVRVSLCRQTAIDLALALVVPEPSARFRTYWGILAAHLAARGFDATPTADEIPDPFHPSVSEIAHGLGLSSEISLNALSLLSSFSVLPDAELTGSKPLLTTVSAEKRVAWRAVPLRRTGNAVVWATDRPLDDFDLRAMTAIFGLPAFPALVDTPALDALLPVVATPAAKLRDEDVTHYLRTSGALSEGQYRTLHLLAKQRRLPELVALREITDVTPADMARATAQAWKTDWAGANLNRSVEAERLLPMESAKLLPAWPISVRNRVLTVATPRSGDPQAVEAIADLTGMQVRALYADGALIAEAVSNRPWRFQPQEDENPEVVPLENDFDAQEYAFLTQTTFFTLSGIRLPDQTDEAILARTPIVYEDGELAWAAVGQTNDYERVEELARLLHRPIRPVVTSLTELNAALTQLAALASIAPDDHPDAPTLAVLDRLRQRGWLSEGQRRRFLTATNWRTEPDEALARATGIEANEAAARLADIVEWPLIDLRPQTIYLDLIDPVGVPYRGKRVVDPVDYALARRITEADALRLDAMPIVQVGKRTTVALASPFLSHTMPELADLLGSEIVPTLTISSDLRAALRRVHRRPTIGEALIETGAIDLRDLEDALRTQKKTGGRIGAVLRSNDLVSQDDIGGALAAQFNMPFFDLSASDADIETIRAIPEEIARTEQVLPVLLTPTSAVLGVVDPGNLIGISRAAEYLEREVETVVITPDDLEAALEVAYRLDYLQTSAFDLMSRTPENSASRVLVKSQKIFFIVLIAVIVFGLIFATVFTAAVFVSFCTLFYTFFSAYRIYLIQRALNAQLEIPVSAEEIAALDERTLPVYSVLVPLYKEKEVLPILVESIRRMDYPKVKLDVLILLEEDDTETIEAAMNANLPAHFRTIVVPDGKPKGKPKALNYGLLHARGEYVVIYDAEDTPDAQQLKYAVVIFQKSDDNLGCIQGKLNYYNRDQNLLTQWFTIEYSMWFDLLLPGLNATDAPIPLGGTSNHFRVRQLQELGAWDPYNVTEDADLGVRLYKAGYRTAVMDSTTYEEANSEFFNWINQRSRWVKGYIQSYLVHMRHPVELWQAIGPKAFISFQLIVGGTFFGFLINPLFWLLTTLWFTVHWHFIEILFPTAIFYIASLGLYLGNFSFTYINVAGCLRRRYYHLVKYALLSPIYWGMMSIAAWKGFLQLFYKPFYWEKTKHGLFTGVPTSRVED